MQIQGTPIPIDNYRKQNTKSVEVKQEEEKTFSTQDEERDFLDVDMDFGLEAINEELQAAEYEPEDGEPEIDTDNYGGATENEISLLNNDEGGQVGLSISSSAEHSKEILKNGDMESSSSLGLKAGLEFSQNLSEYEDFDLNVKSGFELGSEILGQNNNLDVDNVSFKMNLGLSTALRPSENSSMELNTKVSASEQRNMVKSEDGGDESASDKIATNYGAEGDLSVNVGGFSFNPSVGTTYSVDDGSNTREYSANLQISQTFKDESRIELSTGYTNSKSVSEDEYGKNKETTDSLSVGLNMTKQFSENQSLSLGAEYTLDKTKTSYKDFEDAQNNESSKEKEQRVSTNLEYTKNNVTMSADFGINPENPKDWSGGVGFRLRL